MRAMNSLGKKLPITVLALTLLLSACTSFKAQEFNKEANQNVRKIAVAPIGMPAAAQSQTLNAVGNNFGIIGALVETSRQSAASREEAAELTEGGLDYHTYLPAQIESALKAAGFEVTMLPAPRAGHQGKFLATLPPALGNESTLDVYVSYIGYTASGPKAPYRPAVHLEARLVDPRSQKVLFADQIYYNNFQPAAAKTAITIEPDPQAVFADRNAMKAAPEDVTKHLRVAIDAVATELAKQLK